jgi:hypothetical protein
MEIMSRGEFTLCTMGSSFHWMQRDAVLAALDSVLVPDGGVALLGNEVSGWTQGGEWGAVCREVIVEFLGPSRRAGAGTYEDPPESHETVLRRSAFRKVETHRLETAWPLKVDDIVGLQLSSSYASPALLGDRVEAFRNTLTRRLLAQEPSGVLDWVLRTEVILARR